MVEPAAVRKDILHVGLTKAAPLEAAALGPQRVERVESTSRRHPDTRVDSVEIKGAAGVAHDLTRDSGIRAFVAGLQLANPAVPGQADKVFQAIKSARPSARDELAGIAQVWARAERAAPGLVPSRLVLSGHSGGRGVFGENGSLDFDAVTRLARALPRAGAQVEHVALAACNTGSIERVSEFQNVFPNLQSFVGYQNSAPSYARGSGPALQRWEHDTRPGGALVRGSFDGTTAGDNVAVWTKDRGFTHGQGPFRDAQRALARLDAKGTFERYARGETAVRSPYDSSPGSLREYYNRLQRVLQHPELSTHAASAEREDLREKADQALRLLFYKEVRRNFNDAYRKPIADGYGALGLSPPAFDKLGRADALAAIHTFEERLAATQPPPQLATELGGLLEGLRGLRVNQIPDDMIEGPRRR